VSPRSAWEARAAALLGRHVSLLGGVMIGAIAIVAVLARTHADRPAAIPSFLLAAGILASVILAHGAVSSDLRSGVALLWLQKPVNPVRFYLRRGLDLLGLSIVVTSALCGSAALLASFIAGAENGRTVITGLPLTILFAVSATALVLAFSAWGTSLDALLAFFVFYASGMALAEPGALQGVLTWVGFPLESIATINRWFSMGDTENLALSIVRFLVFLASWLALACLGLFVTTRSPLPRESAR
jgi:hypothetical protein